MSTGHHPILFVTFDVFTHTFVPDSRRRSSFERKIKHRKSGKCFNQQFQRISGDFALSFACKSRHLGLFCLMGFGNISVLSKNLSESLIRRAALQGAGARATARRWCASSWRAAPTRSARCSSASPTRRPSPSSCATARGAPPTCSPSRTSTRRTTGTYHLDCPETASHSGRVL